MASVTLRAQSDETLLADSGHGKHFTRRNYHCKVGLSMIVHCKII
jgi:hypothetical protein